MKATRLVCLILAVPLLAACGSAPKQKGPPPGFFAFRDCANELQLKGYSGIKHNLVVVNGVASATTFDSFSLSGRDMSETESQQMRQCYDGKVASDAPVAPAS